MPKRTKTNSYKAIIRKWSEEPTELVKMKKNQLIKYEPIGEEFIQCYLSDTKVNRMKPYYKARHEMPKNWFVGESSKIIVAVQGTEKDGFSIELVTGEMTPTHRLQLKIKCHNYSYETIVGLTLNENMDCDTATKNYINEIGLRAFNTDRNTNLIVVMHHVRGNKAYKNYIEAFENLDENCDQRYLQPIMQKKHELFQKREMNRVREKLYNGTATTEDYQILINLLSEVSNDQTILYIPGAKTSTGTLLFDEEFTDQNGTSFNVIAQKLYNQGKQEILKMMFEGKITVKRAKELLGVA